MPAELHPGFAISLIILRVSNEISLIPVSAKHFRHFAISLIILMLLHRDFVDLGVTPVPHEMNFLEGAIRPLGCADFVDLLTVFHRNRPITQPALAASPNLQIR